MPPFPVRPGLLGPGLCCVLLAAAPVPGRAQDKEKEKAVADTVSWTVIGPRAGWCVDFLMEPKDAADDLVRGFRVVAAREAKGLSPAIARLIADEPTYAEWVPSEVCTYIAEAISLGNRRFDRGDGGQPIAILYWGVAAASAEGGSADFDQVSLRAFGSNSSGLQQNMGTRGIPIDRIQFEVRPVPESSDQEYLIKLNRATISYAGQPKPDSSGQAPPRIRTGTLTGNNRALWNVRMEWRPTAVGGMSGALRVVGKRGLAKSLNRSPIRLLGPTILGGVGQITLTR